MQRQTIDEALWTLQPASFLPHGHAGSPDEAIEPILISGTLDPSPPNRASLLALADGEWRDEALGLDRKSVVEGKRVYVRVDLGVCRIIIQKNITNTKALNGTR